MLAILGSLTIVAFLVSAVLAPRRQLALLLIYVLLSWFTITIHNYYGTTRYLFTGKEWSFLDVIFIFLVLVSWPTSPSAPATRFRNRLDIPMIILTGLVILGFFVGFLRDDMRGPLHVSRYFLFVPIYFIAARLLRDPRSVETFYKTLQWFTLAFFCVHMLLAFRVVVPPMGDSAVEDVLGTFMRVEGYMTPSTYLTTIAVCICMLLYRRPHKAFNIFVLTVATVGIVMTQTRSYYLGLAVVVFGAFALLRGRIKLALVGGITALIIYSAVSFLDLDIFYRFQEGRTKSVSTYWESWRGQEYGMLFNKFREEPMFLMTGRGFGAWHFAPEARLGMMTLFHNEYLKAISSLGLIGFVCHLAILFGGVTIARRYSKDATFGYLVAPGRLLFLAAIPTSIFVGFIWENSIGPILMCFLAIARNSDVIVQRGYDTLSPEWDWQEAAPAMTRGA